ncbi:extracellular matrix 1 [Pelobates cultripes]|uniref:Extracellular matrix 1 n=1 Tax=Pelobates cultripes TaxID=61616 RepID=A0AAD1WUH6_PELCU|nr:extracellular matrix 1 [Pelobates cultripes]
MEPPVFRVRETFLPITVSPHSLFFSAHDLPVADQRDMYQREIIPDIYQREIIPDIYQTEIIPELPAEDDWKIYQREIIPQMPVIQQIQVEPFLIRGEPVQTPRGRRPVSQCGDRPCSVQTSSNNLADFPPGRPYRGNIGNICDASRSKRVYGSHNLPQTGFAHLSRQGYAITDLEEGYTKCCQQSDRLTCAESVWKSTLEAFCQEEFSVKTRHFHCCKKRGSEREICFSSDAPNPKYIFQSMQVLVPEIGSADLPAVGSPRSLKPCPPNSPKCQKRGSDGLPDLSFPPGEPKSSTIQNICNLRKFRPIYTKNQLPQSSFGSYKRQAQSINHLEREFKKCCKDENVTCAHTAWQKVLQKFCSEERTVKTRQNECCMKQDRAAMYTCFASQAPYPKYDREVESVDLGNVTVDSLQKLCGGHKLLTKQKKILRLALSLRETCCNLPHDALQCASEQKEKFIEIICSSRKAVWNDAQKCCKKSNEEKAECFNSHLQNVALVVSQQKKPVK